MIHPTAIIHPEATLGADCEIGPYCHIGPQVTLGPQCRLHSHVVIDGHTTLGAGNEVFPFACLGLKSQDLKWKGGLTRVQIGDRNVFREYCTVHSATQDGDTTRIGSDNHFLAYTHVAHDVQIGNHIVMSNVASLAGHVIVEDHAIVGGLAGVHQFCRIGKYAMIGGASKVVQDIATWIAKKCKRLDIFVANAGTKFDSNGRLTDDVARGLIKQAVEKIFDVTVVKVNTLNRGGKRTRNRRTGTYSTRASEKRAVVTLAPGQRIRVLGE